MNSHEPPCSWQEFLRAPGKALATWRTIAESFGRARRDSPGPRGDIGAVHAVDTPPPIGATATGRAGATNSAKSDHGPKSFSRRARTRHVYLTSYSRSNGIRWALKSCDWPTVCS